MAVPWDIAVAYLLQGSFYCHSIYATVYMDSWRKPNLGPWGSEPGPPTRSMQELELTLG